MYDVSDPRSSLASAAKASAPAATTFTGADYAKFYESKPQDTGPQGRTWYARGQNFMWPIPRRNRAPRLSGKTNPMNTSFLFPMLGPRSQSSPSSRLRVCLANRSRSCLPDAAPCQFRVAAALFAFSPHDRTTSQRNAPMPSPTPRRIPTFLPSSHGRRRPPAIASACTASTFRPNPDASAESFAARPS